MPDWSRDGAAIYFASNLTGDWQVWRHELSTGQETQITHHGGFATHEAYNAKTLYYTKFEGGGIWSVSVDRGTDKHLTEAPDRGYWGHFAVAIPVYISSTPIRSRVRLSFTTIFSTAGSPLH